MRINEEPPGEASKVFLAWEARKHVMGEGTWQWRSGDSSFEGLQVACCLEWHHKTWQHLAADHGGWKQVMPFTRLPGIVTQASSPQIFFAN